MDENGNRTSMTRLSVTLPSPNQATNTSYNESNQMLSFNAPTSSARTMTYDDNGNMTSVTTSCGTTTFTWDARNRLTGISGFNTDCSVLTASFKYDALGRRIEKTNNGQTIQYLYSGIDIIQELENGAIAANYIRTTSIDEPLLRIKSDGTVRYYHTDALESVVALSDDTGVIKTTYSYDPFGNVISAGESSDNPFQYTGRENDFTGLYYYRARYYSPELQRFISEDPIRFRGGDINFFVYAKNRPTIMTDFNGLKGCGPFGMSISDPYGFIKCCNDHDDCYNSCGGKSNCDGTFCGCLMDKCKEYQGKKSSCYSVACSYCGAVSSVGGLPSYIYGCGGTVIF